MTIKTKAFSVLFSITLFVVSCKTTKTNTTVTNTEKSTMKANLIDGTWEANYIMNSPKTFEEMYPRVKPSITFNTSTKQVNGVSGCNSFTGKCTIDGKSLAIDKGLATTRKMCPDMAGEQAFLETLKKATSFSITNKGNTLNLIMGDIAIMRLVRK